MIALYIVLAALALFVAVILIRAARFRPKKQISPQTGEVFFDGDAAVNALQALIRCKTGSYYDHTQEDDAEFEKLIDLGIA